MPGVRAASPRALKRRAGQVLGGERITLRPDASRQFLIAEHGLSAVALVPSALSACPS